MRTVRLLLITALALVSALALTTTAAEAKYGFRLTPHVGKSRTTFKAIFTAPLATDGEWTDYYLEAVGPPACASIFELSGAVQAGQRVVLRLTPSNDIMITNRLRWCRGSYVGYVYWSGEDFDKMIGYFRFGVGRWPVSLG
jgi:hypothetical protein